MSVRANRRQLCAASVFTLMFLMIGPAAAESSYNPEVDEGLVTYWPLDGESGNVTDVAGADLDGINNGATRGVPGINGTEAFRFDGSAYVDLPESSKLPAGSDTYALSAWFNASGDHEGGIIGWGDYDNCDQSNAVRVTAAGNSNDISFKHFWWCNDLVADTGVAYGDSWHHVVVQHDGSTREIWLDGEKVASDSASGHNADMQNARIGRTHEEWFKGIIDEVRVYNRSLNSTEIGTLAAGDVHISGSFESPEAENDSAFVEKGSSTVIDVLANDTDPDGTLNESTVRIESNPSYGVAIVNDSTGEVTYSHDGSDTTSDWFTYTVADNDGNRSNTAFVNITIDDGINDAPTAVNDSGTVDNGSSTSIDVLANDDDPDGTLNESTVRVETSPDHGSATVNQDGSITYSHDGSNTTEDSFNYTVEDDEGKRSNAATVSIEITRESSTVGIIDDVEDGDLSEYTGDMSFYEVTSTDDPISGNYSIDSDQVDGTYPTIVSTSGLDRYPDPGDTFSVDLRIDDRHGYAAVLWGVQNGSHPYPAYRLRLDNGGSQGVEMEKIDPDGPIASHDINCEKPENVLSDREQGTGTNRDCPGGDEPYYVEPEQGVTYTCTITWEVDSNGDPTGKFPYRCVDQNGNLLVEDKDPKADPEAYHSMYTDGGIGFMSNEGSDDTGGGGTWDNLELVRTNDTSDNTTSNDAPTASDDSGTVVRGDSTTVDVLANDTDSDGSLNESTVVVEEAPDHGETSVNASTGAVTYSHDGSNTSSDSFTYSVEDDDGTRSNNATVSISIEDGNDAPTAVNDSGKVDLGGSTTIDLVANDTDPEGALNASSVRIENTPENGSVTVDSTGVATYSHDGSSTARDIFTYSVEDDGGKRSNNATVTVEVTNDTSSGDSTGSELPEGLKQGLVGYWAMNNLSGDVWDRSGNSYHGTNNGARRGVSGYNGSKAFDFDGSDDEVSLPGLGISGDQSVTIAAWVNVEEGAGADRTVFGSGNDNGDEALGLRTTSNTDGWKFYFWGNDLQVDTPSYAGKWVHVVATYNAGTSERVLYQNGVKEGSDSPSDASFQDTDYSIGSFKNTDYFKGAMDEVMLYNRSLNSTEVSRLFNSTPVAKNSTGNAAPTATDDTGSVGKGNTTSIDVLANDDDPDGTLNASSVRLTSLPDHGSATTWDNGSVSYSHDGSDTTKDSFTYTVADNNGSRSNNATVTVSILSSGNGTVDDFEDGDIVEYDGQLSYYRIRNDSTIDGIHSLQVPDAGNGGEDGTWENGGYNTMVSTSGLDRYPAPGDTFSVDIRVDDKDTYGAVLWGVQRDTKFWPGYRLRIDTGASAGVEVEKIAAKNDSDIESHYIDKNNQSVEEGVSIVLSDRENGGFSDEFDGDSGEYNKPQPDVVYTCTITWKKNGSMPYRCEDQDGNLLAKDSSPKPDTEFKAGGIGFMSTQSGDYVEGRGATWDNYRIINDSSETMDGTNSPPTAVNDSGTVTTGNTTEIDVLANDTDSDGSLNESTVVVEEAPDHGTTTVDSSGNVTYDHDGSNTSEDSFKYSVEDDDGNRSNTATVSITIAELINEQPTAVDDTGSVGQGNSTTIEVLANDTDSDGSLDVSTVEVESPPSSGNATVNTSTGAITYSHDGSNTSSDSFTYSVEDNDGERSNNATVSINVELEGETSTSSQLEVSSQREFNFGSFAGTSADRSDNSGDLGLGYRNGSNPESPEGLVAYWRVDATSDQVPGSPDVKDYSRSNMHLEAVNGPTRGVRGLFSTNAMDFDGSDDYLVRDNPDSTKLPSGNDDRTLAMWVRYGSYQDFTMFGGYGHDDTNQNFQIGMDNSGKHVFELYQWGGSNDWETSANASKYADGEWHLLTVTKNGDKEKFYVDGELKDSRTHTSDTNVADGHVVIGNEVDYEDTGEEQEVDAAIDEIQIYNRSLSSGSVRNLYFNGRSGRFNGTYTRNGFDVPEGESPVKLGVHSDNITATGTSNATFTVTHSSGEQETVRLDTGDNVNKNYTLDFTNTGGSADIQAELVSDRSTPGISPVIRSFTLFTN